MSRTRSMGRHFRHALLGAACLAGTATMADAGEGADLGGTPQIEVFKPDGSLQCEPGSGTPLATMQAELRDAGIRVYSARSASDGMMHPQACGTPTGLRNVFSIDAAALDQALAQGFQPLLERPDEPR
jgi:hypothetical protein